MMKMFLRAITLSIILGSASLAYADSKYDVYWVDNPASPQFAFKLLEGSAGHLHATGGTYESWHGDSHATSAMSLEFALFNPEGTASMVFHGEFEDRTGKNYIGAVMVLDQAGRVIRHDALIKIIGGQ